jgi:hypothetical protein
MDHKVHACEFVGLPFDITCAVLDRDRQDILQRATRVVFARPQENQAPGEPPVEWPRVVSAALERHEQPSAIMAMHWIQPDPTVEAEGGLSAWLRCHLRLLPRQAGDYAVTEVLLVVCCDISPPEAERFDEETGTDFLRNVVTEIERHAAPIPIHR